MGKASSAKKVAKAARAGGRSSGVRQRNLLFPGIIIGIFIFGIGLVAYARSDYQDSSVNVPPTMGDHWHAAYGVYICGEWANVAEYFEGAGIHSHQDEVIHIHPSSRRASGDNARMKVFLDDSPLLDIDNDRIKIGDEEWRDGEDTCEVDGEEVEGEVVMAQWDDVASDADYALRTSVREERFSQDGEGYVFAFVPKGETDDIPKPRSLDTLLQVMGSPITDIGGGDIDFDNLPEGMTEDDFREMLEQGDGVPPGEDGPEEEPAPVGPVAPEDPDTSDG